MTTETTPWDGLAIDELATRIVEGRDDFLSLRTAIEAKTKEKEDGLNLESKLVIVNVSGARGSGKSTVGRIIAKALVEADVSVSLAAGYTSWGIAGRPEASKFSVEKLPPTVMGARQHAVIVETEPRLDS